MAQHLCQILGDTLLTTQLDGLVPQELPSPQVRICLGFVIFFSSVHFIGRDTMGLVFPFKGIMKLLQRNTNATNPATSFAMTLN